MKRIIATVVLLSILALPSLAQEKEKKSSLKKASLPRLSYVNLDAELGLRTELLKGFGIRTDQALREADAATVASQAIVLGFAEEVSKKKSKTITSIQLLNEASRLAEEKRDRIAAEAVIIASTRIKGGDAIAASLGEAMKSFATKRGAGSFVAYVKVVNKAGRLLDVYIDGRYAGFLYADESQSYTTGNGTTNARVSDAFGNTTSETFFLEPEETFTWTIQP